MRAGVLIYMSAMIAVFMIVILSSLTMRASYADNIQRSLDESIDYSIRLLQLDADKVIDEDTTVTKDNLMGNVSGLEGMDTFKQDFVKYLTRNINTRINRIDVNI